MDTRHLVLLIFSACGAALLFSFRNQIAEAIQRGPWNGGGPPGIGPAGAADPFRRKVKKPQLPA